MPSQTEASARPHATSMDDYQGWMSLRAQSECLAYSLLDAVKRLHELPATSEANQSLADIRDRLSDLVGHVRETLKGGDA